MAFQIYPYTNFHDLNLDWILEEVKRVSETVDNWGTTVLQQANDYTDTSTANLDSKLTLAMAQFKADVNNANAQYQQNINNALTQFQQQIKEQNTAITANLAAARGYTDTRIAQNNEILYDKISEGIVDVKVLNIFTGQYVTIQEMFNYLATFHLTGAITISEIVELGRTVDTVVGYAKTVTDFVIDGSDIFNER